MPKKFKTKQKMEAFRLLFETFGDTYHVSQQTGISERALQYWKSKYRLQVKLATPDQVEPQQQLQKETYSRMRDELIERIDEIMKHLKKNNSPEMAATLTPALTRLIDRIAKLEQLIDDRYFYYTVRWINEEELETNEFIVRNKQLRGI